MAVQTEIRDGKNEGAVRVEPGILAMVSLRGVERSVGDSFLRCAARQVSHDAGVAFREKD